MLNTKKRRSSEDYALVYAAPIGEEGANKAVTYFL